MKWPDLSEQKGIVMAAVPRNPPKTARLRRPRSSVVRRYKGGS